MPLIVSGYYMVLSSSLLNSFTSLIVFFLCFVIILFVAIVLDKKVNPEDIDVGSKRFSKVIDAFESNEAYKISFIVITSVMGLAFLVTRGIHLWSPSNMPTTGGGTFILSTVMSSIISFFNGINSIAVEFFNNVKNDIFSNEETRSALLRYAGLYGFIFMIAVILYIASTDPEALTKKAYLYVFSIIIPLVILIGFALPFSTAKRSSTSTILLLGVGLTIITAAFYSYTSMDTTTALALSYLMNGLMAIIVLLGLALFFYIFSNYLKSIEGFAGFFIYLLFYIPCLLIDLSNYILNELKMTTRPIYILFILEIILILLYIYIPGVLKQINQSSDTIVLLENGAFLDIKTAIGNSYQLRNTEDTPPTTMDGSTLIQYRKSYSISMWIYTNIQPPNNKLHNEETVIFNYGGGKPKITYSNNSQIDKSKDKYVIYFTDATSGPKSYELIMTSQKWNNLVFNYYADKVDLFVNGTLERTFKFINNGPTYLATDTVETGSKDGLSGAVCNVRYYIRPLKKSQIVNNYNLLKNKNPPTFD